MKIFGFLRCELRERIKFLLEIRSMNWESKDILAYQNYCFSRLRSYDQEIDCADLALVCLIDFAYEHKLPVALKYYSGGWKWYKSRDYKSVDKFRELITRQMGALNVIDNTKPISIEEASTGDLIMTKWNPSLGHTRVIWQVVSYTLSSGEIGHMVWWYQGNLPPVVPVLKTDWWTMLRDSSAQNIFDKKPRRWNFAQFG